jgi:phosphoribosylformylglycinamidine synthase
MNASPVVRLVNGAGDHRPQHHLLRARVSMCEHGPMIFSVHVEVRLRPGIADPQGSTIERAMPTLGFAGVSGVRVGKSIRFEIEAANEASARAEAEDLCRRFLTNPVIEDAIVELEPVGVPS